MTDTIAVDPTGHTGPPPHALLFDLATRAVAARCLHVVAALGVADALGAEGSHVDTLAASVDANADALARMLRLLAANGVFDVDLPVVRHNDASLVLRSDHPASMGPFAHMMGLPLSWEPLAALETTARTGRAGIFSLDDDGLFAYLDKEPEQHAIFDRAMTGKSGSWVPFVVDAYDFARHRTVADVGGGRGHLLNAIAERHPAVTPVLVDLPEVIARVAEERSTGERVQLVAADFFTDELPSADAYVLMEIIHDWDDADAIRILQNVRRNATDDAAVLIVEAVLADTPDPDQAKTLDVMMLCVTGGRERTPDEYATLFAAAGLELVRVIRTPAGGVVEARVS